MIENLPHSAPTGPEADRFRLERRVERFLYDEAALLDSWQLAEWLELFTESAIYVVPATDHVPGRPDGSELVLIYDERPRIAARVARLTHPNAHAEVPRPRTRRLVTNVRIVDPPRGQDRTDIEVAANFVIYSARHRRVDTFVGSYLYRLESHSDTFRIAERRAELDLEDLVESAHAVNIII